jgi:UDP-N-acetylglucosamine 2-epimerase (non-hydrolysing)
VPAERIHLVGNVMIDALESSRPKWEASDINERLGLEPGTPYAVLTLHRPSNTDEIDHLDALLEALGHVGRQVPVIFPVHPRTRQQLRSHRRLDDVSDDQRHGGVRYIEPLGYLDFVALMSRARLVLTDSGGIQEETTVLGVPCLTLRENTERPVTVTAGTNRVIGTDPERVVREALGALTADPPSPRRPPLWDGYAALRIIDILAARRAGA